MVMGISVIWRNPVDCALDRMPESNTKSVWYSMLSRRVFNRFHLPDLNWQQFWACVHLNACLLTAVETLRIANQM